MKIGIIVAMQKELDLLLPHLTEKVEREAHRYNFITGRMAGKDVVVMKCGIGKVNAALGTMAMIDVFSPDLIINTGVAGGTGGGAGILDVVVADDVVYHDVWCGPGTEWGEAAGCPRMMHGSSKVAEVLDRKGIDGVKRGIIASGDIFVSKKEEVDHIRRHFPGVMAVDMESGAIAQTCTLAGTDFAVVRVVSDTPGAADNISQYESFWSDAPARTFATLSAIVNAL